MCAFRRALSLFIQDIFNLPGGDTRKCFDDCGRGFRVQYGEVERHGNDDSQAASLRKPFFQWRVSFGRDPAAGMKDIAAGDIAGLRGKDDPAFMDDSDGGIRYQCRRRFGHQLAAWRASVDRDADEEKRRQQRKEQDARKLAARGRNSYHFSRSAMVFFAGMFPA